MASGDTKTEAMLNVLGNGGTGDEFRGCCNTKTQQYILDAIDRVQSVEDEVEEIKNNPDVADIVATYSDLQAYDKSKLADKDIIRVLADETHNGDSTYYRYSKSSNDFTYIGESKQYVNFVGTDGTAAGVAGLVPGPATTDAGKFLKADGTWDTVGGGGSEFVDLTVTALGTDTITVTASKTPTEVGTLVSAGKEVIYRLVLAQTVPGFAAGTYLLQTVMAGSTGVIASSIATPDTISTRGYIFGQGTNEASGTIYVKNLDAPVVQTTGTSTTDVMSQDAVTKRLYPRFGVYNDAIGIVGANESQDSDAGLLSVGIGSGSVARGDNAIAIGAQTKIYAAGVYSTAVGSSAKTEGHSRAVALGNAADAAFDNSVAIGSNAKTTRVGEVNVGADTSGRGYNSTNYRVIGGVHDGQLAQDAVTVNQVNSLIDNLNSALNTNIPHIGA